MRAQYIWVRTKLTNWPLWFLNGPDQLQKLNNSSARGANLFFRTDGAALADHHGLWRRNGRTGTRTQYCLQTVNVWRSTSDGQLQTVNFGRSSETSLAILLCDIFEMSFLTNLAFDWINRFKSLYRFYFFPFLLLTLPHWKFTTVWTSISPSHENSWQDQEN